MMALELPCCGDCLKTAPTSLGAWSASHPAETRKASPSLNFSSSPLSTSRLSSPPLSSPGLSSTPSLTSSPGLSSMPLSSLSLSSSPLLSSRLSSPRLGSTSTRPESPSAVHDIVLGSADWALPSALEATAPPEARGLERDQVRLMVSSPAGVWHSSFRKLPGFLRPGDVLAVNTSATRNAALDAWRPDGSKIELHLSTQLDGRFWTVELRRLEGTATKPLLDATEGEVLRLPEGVTARLLAPYRGSRRLWIASLDCPVPIDAYLARVGFPIRYGYVAQRWPSSMYQTVFAEHLGSAEMPSAGRPFSPRVLAELESRGVQIVPLVLHTGVASLEEGERPYPEQYEIPETSAEALNRASGRIIAVGTTVVRAVESSLDEQGRVRPGQAWTEKLITPQTGVRKVDGLLTGFHEPRSTHLQMLEALAGRAHLRNAYREALDQAYLWHEFGDVHLLLQD